MHKNSCQGTVWCMSQEEKKTNVFDDKLKNSLIIFLFWKQTFYFAPTDVWARKREETNARSICPQSIVLSFLEAEGKERANPKLQFILMNFSWLISVIKVCFTPSKNCIQLLQPQTLLGRKFLLKYMGGKAEGCHITPHKDTTLRKQKCLCSPENGINSDAMDKNVLQMVSSYEILFDRHILNPFSTKIS